MATILAPRIRVRDAATTLGRSMTLYPARLTTQQCDRRATPSGCEGGIWWRRGQGIGRLETPVSRPLDALGRQLLRKVPGAQGPLRLGPPGVGTRILLPRLQRAAAGGVRSVTNAW